MKKVLLIVTLLVGFTAMAQRGPHGSDRGTKDLTPEQMATLQTKKMTLALDLTEAQQEKVKALHLENAKMRKAKMEERKAQKEDGEKKPTAEERYARSNDRLDHQIAHKAEMKNILSSEQYEKWQKMQHRSGKHRKGKKGKGQGNHGKNKEE